MATEATSVAEKDKKKTDAEMEAAERSAKEANAKLTGVGTRIFVGRTRGKGSIVVKWNAFDKSQPSTLPDSIQKFAEIAGIANDDKGKAVMLDYLIDGYNEQAYEAASDPLREFIEDWWPDEAQAQFRIVARNYAKGVQVPLDKAVELIKPGFDAQYPKPATA